MAGVLVFIWRKRRIYPGFGPWALHEALVGAGLGLMGLRDLIPDTLSTVGGNACLPAGALLSQGTLDALRARTEEVKVLEGLLPICASCKRIRDEDGMWSGIEVYIRDHSGATFTHGICPDCAARLYPGLVDEP